MAVPRSPGNSEGLGPAADIFVKAIAAAAAKFSTEIPPSVHKYRTHDFYWVSAGWARGEWHWTPIHAWMFDEPHAGSIPKHPLFAHGPRGTDGWKNWYYQPYRPFMEEGMYAALDAAESAYADAWIATWAAENGFK